MDNATAHHSSAANVCDGLGGSAQRRLLKCGLALLGSDVVAWLLAARPAAERAYAAHGVLMNSAADAW
jgi:hypothetical protein